MRRRPHAWRAAALLGWAGCILLVAPVLPASGATDTGESAGRVSGGFDRGALREELARPMAALQEQPAAALRAYVQRLSDLQFAMELALDVSPAERAVLSEQILTRIGQVGLLLRRRGAGDPIPGEANGAPPGETASPPADDLFTIALQNSGLLVRLLAGLLIAYALGSLVARRRRRERAAPAGPGVAGGRPPGGGAAPGPEGGSQPVSLVEIRRALAAGRTVMLQMGYEIVPARRDRFLMLIREVQEVLRGVKGQSYTVWEDPGRPNRFYELLVCRQMGVLDELTSGDGPLARLVEQVEACRVPDGFALHRVWWDAVPEHAALANILLPDTRGRGGPSPLPRGGAAGPGRLEPRDHGTA